VPLAFAADHRSPTELVIYSALDEKPKSVADPRSLGRVRDIAVRPHVTLLVDHWSEDWSELAWLRLEGTATILEPTDDPHGEHAAALRLLRERYPQYKTQKLEMRPAIRIVVERAVGWWAGSTP
jgi:PPOX class probable F420-dependent enzyme